MNYPCQLRCSTPTYLRSRATAIVLCLLFILSYSRSTGQPQTITFPDANLRKTIVQQYSSVYGSPIQIPGINSIDFTHLNFNNPDPWVPKGVNSVMQIFIDFPLPESEVHDLTGIEKLPNLKFLSVQGNSGLHLPAGFENLTSLGTLDLNSNNITSLPVNFSNLLGLNDLIISNNQLTSLPKLPAGLKYLEAQNNKLTSLPVFPGGLGHVDISGNQLTFEDIEPIISYFNLANGESFFYRNQADFVITPLDVDLNAGQPLQLTAQGFIGGANNRYQWFRDGAAVSPVSTSPAFFVANATPAHAGHYVCKVTNTVVPDLTISSHMIEVTVTPGVLPPSTQFWGMTSAGGKGHGSIFKMNGNNPPQIIKQFDQQEGSSPTGNLIAANDGFLYGMTLLGGLHNQGVIFRISQEGTLFQKLYDFDGTTASMPYGSLMQASNGSLYGIASKGSNQQLTGIIFKINTGDNVVFTKVFEFPFNGYPSGNLIQASDGHLYGMTKTGDTGTEGTIFKIKPDGTGFQILHSFDEQDLDGHHPFGSLIQASNGYLYGMTSSGGANVQGDGGGTIFRINTDGSGFQKLCNLQHSTQGDLVQTSNGDLYGMTKGGTGNHKGNIFKINLNVDVVLNDNVLYSVYEFGAFPSGNLVESSNGELYGMTMAGGSNDKGVIFKIAPDGSGFSKLHDFDGQGNEPQGSLLLIHEKQPQVITFNTIDPKTFGGAPFQLMATGGASGNPITFKSSNQNVATISGDMVTIVGAGSTTITASQEGNNNFFKADDQPQTLVVNKQNQIITFSTIDPKTFGGAPFQLMATGGASGNPITFTSSNQNVATISGDMVTIVGAGSTTITASQEGNHDYLQAERVQRVLVVSKRSQSIQFPGLQEKQENDQPFTLSGSATSGLMVSYSTTDDEITLQDSKVIVIKPGLVTIQANQSGNANYNPALPVKQSFCIKPSKPSITTLITDAAFPSLKSSSSEGNQWYFNGSAIAGATQPTISATMAGQYTVKITIQTCSSELSEAVSTTITEIEHPAQPFATIYPNPAGNYILLTMQTDKEHQPIVTIHDRSGRLIQKGGRELVNDPINIDHLPQGIYVLSVVVGDRRSTQKFIKE